MKVLVAMSGGVDSSVAAKLLCDGGDAVLGGELLKTNKQLNYKKAEFL